MAPAVQQRPHHRPVRPRCYRRHACLDQGLKLAATLPTANTSASAAAACKKMNSERIGKRISISSCRRAMRGRAQLASALVRNRGNKVLTRAASSLGWTAEPDTGSAAVRINEFNAPQFQSATNPACGRAATAEKSLLCLEPLDRGHRDVGRRRLPDRLIGKPARFRACGVFTQPGPVGDLRKCPLSRRLLGVDRTRYPRFEVFRV